MTPTSVTLSSVGTSPAIPLDNWSGRATLFAVTGSSSGTFAGTLQVSLDPSSAANPVWINDATLAAVSSNALVQYYASPCQARLNSTAMSSAAVSLKIVQGLAG
jgi:hypothetical protein